MTEPAADRGAEARRLAEARAGTVAWRTWGAYLSLRQWGTVREDYSADGNAWAHLPFDHARSRAYRWGEDVKEHWWPLDATPTHSLLAWRYRYPHAAFPYARLREANRRRTRDDDEFELLDTGVLDGGRFTDVTYAKAGPSDLVMRIACTQPRPGSRTAARAADRVVPQHLVVGSRPEAPPPPHGGRRRRARHRARHARRHVADGSR